MHELRSAAREAAEDIFFGQVVIIWARWFLILASAVLTLWSAGSVGEMTVSSLLVAALMAMNFYLHGRYLVERPANQTLTLAASGLDLLIVSAIVLTWHGQSGFASPYFVFYYPLLLAVALVLPPRLTLIYAGAALATYTAICFLADPALAGNAGE